MKLQMLKIFSIFLGLIVLVQSGLYQKKQEQNARGKRPILPLSYSSSKLPDFTSSLRDPNLRSKMISDDFEAETINSIISEGLTDLPATSGYARAETTQTLYLNNLVLSWYYEDLLTGKYSTDLPTRQIKYKLKNARRYVTKFGRQYLRYSKNAKGKVKAQYHIGIVNYLNNNYRLKVIRNFKKINRRLPNSLKRRAIFLIGIRELEYGSRTSGMKKIQSQISRLPLQAAQAGRLAIARYLAGINRNGKKINKTNKTYRNWLIQATGRARNMSAKDKNDILRFSIAVWRGAEGSKARWNKPPIRIRSFKQHDAISAIIERRAIYQWQKRQYSSAIKIYSNLLKNAKNDRIAIRIQDRIIQIQFQKFRKTKNPRSYERALVSGEKKFSEKSSFGSNQTALDNAVRRYKIKYKELVTTNLSQAKSKRAKNKFRKQAISMANRYLKTNLTPNENIQIREQMNRVYENAGWHKKAVIGWLNLAKDYPDQAKKWYKFGIINQRKISAWPKNPPWIKTLANRNTSKKHRKQRLILLAMHQKMKTTFDQNNWNTVGHIGLLQISTGQKNAAINTFTTQLNNMPKYSASKYAAGYVLNHQFDNKQWQKLEDISRLCLSKKIRPLVRNRPVNIHIYLSAALFEGGKQAWKNKKFDVAVSKLKEFTTSYTKDRRRDEGLFLLAFSYRGNSEHMKSIETLIAHAEQYKRSRFRKVTLLEGGSWAMPMALENSTIFFWKKYLAEFARDQKSQEIRELLKPLLMGRRIYGDAGDILRYQIQDSRIPLQSRLNYALSYMDLENRFGEQSRAIWAMNHVFKLANNDDVAKAKAIGVESRYLKKIRSYKRLTKNKLILQSLDQSIDEVREQLGFILLTLAEEYAEQTGKEENNLTQTDPLATINKHYGIFLKSKTNFDQVCELEVSWCAPAMLSLSDTTVKTITSIQDLTIPETLDEKIVIKFNDRKQSIISTLSNYAQEAEIKSLQVAEKGYLDPEKSQQIIWNASRDWNFDRVSGETGIGFVQWSPNINNLDDNDSTLLDENADLGL